MAIDMKALARTGAAQRVAELRAELAQIERAFPGLGSGRGSAVAIGIAPVRPRRTRKPMTAAQKRAVGIRMKKYWAARRKEKES
jgi:hypothetical protein